METQDGQVSDFKSRSDEVLRQLAKRRLKDRFYKLLGYSPSLVSLWRSGKKNFNPEQERAFYEAAVSVIGEYEREREKLNQETDHFYHQFRSLTSAQP